jgi:hypothetical protein
MKKTLLITFGALLILLIIGVWAYLFAYGTPQSGDNIFTRFGFNDTDSLPVMETPATVDVDDTSDGVPQNLRQLTARPVAGATFTETGILYVEEGTGHVYHIDLGNGEEKLMSGTTIQGTHRATFSPDGAYVAVTAVKNGVSETIVGLIGGLTGKLTGVSLPLGASEVTFGTATDTVMYLLREERGSSGYSYDIVKGAGTQVFSIPLQDIHVLWGEPTYVYTTPTSLQTGYLYRVEGNSLEYVHKGGVGLVGLLYDDGLVITTANGDTLSSSGISSGGTVVPLDVPLVPEKCTNNEATSSVFYCGVSQGISSRNFPDSWYKGSVSFSDSLYSIDAETGTVMLLSDFVSTSGREIDVSSIGTDMYGELVYFINKNDNTLWMYDMTY